MSASCSRASVCTQSTEEVDGTPPSNKKYSIIVDSEGVKGKDATRWSSRCGFLVRRHIPIGYEEWRKIDDCYKDNLWEILMKEFETNLEPNIARPILEKKISQYFRTVKSTLRMKYLKEDGHLVPKRVALGNRPEDIDKIWWGKFVDIEYGEKKKKQCEKNTENKAKHVIPHTLGRKSYVQLCDELAMKNPEEKLTRAMVWKLAHKSKKTGEVIPCAAEKYALIEAAETLVEAGEKSQKLEAGSAGMKNIETLIEALEKRKNLETGSDGMKKKAKTLIKVGKKRQNLEACSSGMNKDKTLTEAGEKRQKLGACNGGMNKDKTSTEAGEKRQKLRACNGGMNKDKTSTEAGEKRQKIGACNGGMENLETLIEAAEKRQTSEAGNDGNEDVEDLENDPIPDVFGPGQRKSHRHEINSAANINQAKFTRASKATADSKESEDLQQWKMEIQDHVQTQIDDAIKLMSSKMLSMQHNMQQNILQFMNQLGGKMTRRTEVASNVERTNNGHVTGFGVQSNSRDGSSRSGRQHVMLLSRDLKEVAKGYVVAQKSCHRRKAVQNGEKIVWVDDVLDPEALIYDGPQNGKHKLSEIGDGGHVIWPVFRLRDL